MGTLAGTMTAIRRVVDLALIGLIVVVLFGLILGKLVPLTGRQTIIIGGGSMEPAIGLGAAIVVAPIRPADLAEGDVVSLQVGPERTTYTHRVVEVAPRPDGVWIRTKGDANAEPDPTLVAATEVLYHQARRRPMQDVLTCIRHGVPIANNRASADFMISSPLMRKHYDRLAPDYSAHAGRLAAS